MPSLTKQRIKKVFDGAIGNIRQGKEPNIKGEMIKQGYAETSAKVLMITKTKEWQNLLTEIDENEILETIKGIMRSDDKRSSLAAADMLLKLKDKYPAQKSKVVGMFQDLTE